MHTPDGAAVVADAQLPPLAERAADGGRRRWPAGTRWVLAAAALASVLTLVIWAGVLWRYLQPSAFRGSLMLGPPLSLQFMTFMARAAFHAAVVAGVAAALAGWRRARALLLGAGVAVLALAVYEFAQSTLLPPAALRPRQGPDFIVNATMGAGWLVETYATHLLLVLVLARVRPGRGPLPAVEPAAAPEPVDAGAEAGAGAGGRRELGYYVERGPGGRVDGVLTALIVLVAVIESVTQLLQWAALMWIQFQPSTFKFIATNWGWSGVALSGGSALLHFGVLAGAGALLARRWTLGRRLLMAAALALILLRAGSYVYGTLNPPAGMRRDTGAEWIVNTAANVSRMVTAMIVYALLALAMWRAREDAPARGGT